MDQPTLAETISEQIEAVAGRFPTWSEMQSVRAYLLSSAFQVPAEDIRRRLGARGSIRNLVARGGILVREAVESQLITMEEMRAWLAQVRIRHDA